MDLRLADESDHAALEGMLLEAVNWSSEGTQVTLELSALIEVGRERGFEGLSLSVESRNQAVHLLPSPRIRC